MATRKPRLQPTAELQTQFEAFCNLLNPRERMVLATWLRGAPLTEIRPELSPLFNGKTTLAAAGDAEYVQPISLERVRQIRNTAIRKLRFFAYATEHNDIPYPHKRWYKEVVKAGIIPF